MYRRCGLTHADGITTWSFSVGAERPFTWSTSLTIFGSEIPLWSIPVPAIDPAISLGISFAVPPIGVIGVQSAVSFDGGGCSDSDTVDTGS